MVVYWDLAALVNGAADYLLLLSAARLAGRTVPRLRLLGAAAFGAAYAVLRLVLPCSPWLTAAAFVGMALLAAEAYCCSVSAAAHSGASRAA